MEPNRTWTERAGRALILAQQEALRFNQAVAGPEHILLGLLREGTGLASGILEDLGVGLIDLRSTIEAQVQKGDQRVRASAGFTSEGNAVQEQAAAEASGLHHDYIGQEHLLLALLAQNGPIVDLLASFHITYEIVRQQTLLMLGRGRPLSARAEPPIKRYNLALPEDLFHQVENLAEREHMSVLEVLRRSVKLGLFAAEIQNTPNAKFIIREGDSERQLILL